MHTGSCHHNGLYVFKTLRLSKHVKNTLSEQCTILWSLFIETYVVCYIPVFIAEDVDEEEITLRLGKLQRSRNMELRALCPFLLFGGHMCACRIIG